ncbi:hypothetical protein EV202_1136 [Bacteroides heparinolyticus]|uniref:Uncharacterized protein n=1 Tax=Prevotella heparinolytica TaxID=28113 RepID=A0A4R2LKR8_9BACE|nr:hypothetical protein EV202_1136 [Bacteroides heparinolyticus]
MFYCKNRKARIRKKPSLLFFKEVCIILPDELLQTDKHLRKFRILYMLQDR